MGVIDKAGDFRPARRISKIDVSDILIIARAANERKRAGNDVLILAAGEPDFDTPENVKAAAVEAIRAGLTKYTTVDGTDDLKLAIAAKFRSENGLDYGKHEITVSAGAKQVIHNALMATIDPGDEVIVLAPYWTSYVDMVKICGGVPVEVIGDSDNGFRASPESIGAAITSRTRWIIMNSPSNPSGCTCSAEDLKALAAVLENSPHVWVMSDEVYEDIIYDGRKPVSIASASDAMRSRTLTINAVSKSYAMTGWRLGYGGGPAALIQAMAVVQSQSTSNPCSISQAAAIEALRGGKDVVRKRRAEFEGRRDWLVERVAKIPGLELAPPQGAFYGFIKCKDLLGQRSSAGEVISSDRVFCSLLLEKYDVAVIPGSSFGLEGYFRVSFASSLEVLRAAFDRIEAACRELSR